VQQSQAIQYFQAGVNTMVEEGAEPADVAGTLLGIAHQLMVQNYGPEQTVEWINRMAQTIADAHASGQADKSGSH
jgi:hypothetical protein